MDSSQTDRHKLHIKLNSTAAIGEYKMCSNEILPETAMRTINDVCLYRFYKEYACACICIWIRLDMLAVRAYEYVCVRSDIR